MMTKIVFCQLTVMEKMPEFKGGQKKLYKYIQENVHYPKEAKERCITGRFYVSFIIDTLGNIDSIKVNKRIHTLLKNEAIRVVKTMNGMWSPGRQEGRPVKVMYNLPFAFDIDGCSENKNTHFVEGVEAYDKHNIQLAIDCFKDVLEYDENDIKSLNRLATIYIELKDNESACIYLKRIKETGKKNVDDLLLKYCNK